MSIEKRMAQLLGEAAASLPGTLKATVRRDVVIRRSETAPATIRVTAKKAAFDALRKRSASEFARDWKAENDGQEPPAEKVAQMVEREVEYYYGRVRKLSLLDFTYRDGELSLSHSVTDGGLEEYFDFKLDVGEFEYDGGGADVESESYQRQFEART